MKHWYKVSEKEERLNALNSRVSELKDDMSSVWFQSRIYQNFYDNTSNTNHFSRGDTSNIFLKKIVYNMTTSIVDHATASISRIKPKPAFSNHGMNILRRSNVKRIDKATLKSLKENKFYKQARDIIKQGCITNIGVGKIYVDKMNDAVRFQKRDIDCIAFEKPYRGKSSRDEILELNKMTIMEITEKFKGTQFESEVKAKIMEKYNIDPYAKKLTKSDLSKLHTEVEIYELIKASSGKLMGKKAIFTENMLLLWEDWKPKWIPYDFWYWSSPTEGMIGRGIIETLAALQWSINVLTTKLNRSIDVSIYPYVLAHINSRVGKKFNNKVGNVVEWQGEREPKHVTSPIAHPQVFAFLDQKIDMCYKILGLDQIQLQRGAPSGGNNSSGVALENYRALENSKYYSQSSMYEELTEEVAKKTSWFMIKYNIKNINKKITMKTDEILENVVTWPVSLFPYTPEGQMQRSETLINLGVFSMEEIADIFEFPDVSKHLDTKGKRISAIFDMIEKVLTSKKDMPLNADPILGYSEQKSIAEGIYGEVLMDDEFIEKNEHKVELLREFISECSTELHRIEKERAEALLQGNAPQQLVSQPNNQSGATNQDPAALGATGNGQSTGEQPI